MRLAAGAAASWADRSVPLGMYWRSRPLVSSFDPRCQGECGSQKQTGMPVAMVKAACLSTAD